MMDVRFVTIISERFFWSQSCHVLIPLEVEENPRCYSG